MDATKKLIYTTPARWFHWTVVVLLALQYSIGWLMPDVKKTTPAVGLIAIHLAVGLIVLIVVFARCGWRLGHAAPELPANLPPWQTTLANIVHVALYILLFALPVTGWLNASTRTWEPVLLGVVPLPRLVPLGNSVGHGLGEYHSILSWVLIAFIAVHVLGAIYHQFVLKDRLLQRMWNRPSDSR
jgi:cytochrome b561